VGSTVAYELAGSIYLNVTNRCTGNCVFCIRRGSPGVGGFDLRLDREPSAGEVIAALGDPGRYDEVVFCGYGEPLLRLEVVRRVAGAVRRRSDTPVRVDTNGHANLYHGRDIVPELRRLVDHASISLNAQDAETYERLSRPLWGPKAYQGVLEFARRCVDVLPRVTLSVVSLPAVDIEACRRIADTMGADFRVREFRGRPGDLREVGGG